MKSKNVVLAIIAIVFAIGGALASKKETASNAFIWIRPGSGNFVCTDTGKQCDELGDSPCEVQVLIGGSIGKLPNAHNAADCQQVMVNEQGPASGGTLALPAGYTVSNNGTTPI